MYRWGEQLKEKHSAAMTRRRLLQEAVAGGLLVAGANAAQAFPDKAEPQTLREVLNIFHLDKAARRNLSLEAYHFIVGAADDGHTKQENRLAFERVKIRPRRLVDVSGLDTSVRLFGKDFSSPIIIAPVGDQQAVHIEGELATARAAARKQHLMIAAMLSNYNLAEITAQGAPTWLQLYPSQNREFMLKLLRDGEQAGCDAVVVTIDGPVRGNHEAAHWFAKHRDATAPSRRVRLGNFENFDGRKGIGNVAFTWNDIDWLRAQTTMRVVLKGVVTVEDAKLCRKHGVDGVIVSNHGGRQEGNGRATLDVLPEIAAELGRRMPVLMDGGIRRGSDIFKALASGADAVCIGRPYLWGLGAFGQAGVSKCLRILQRELERAMQHAGTPKLADISVRHIWRPPA